ncbi:CDP-diacylglycerol--glycerol-3-phosphate 3-phosphatidyltransferase [bacterium]|nr:CDP-diacylglycerol--glycerol-3-phosphate 3-phosphatidyltransferase [bacterium]
MKIPKHLPNLLTISRLVFSPVIALLFVIDEPWCRIALLGLIIFCEITDALDGYIARKYNLVTDLGKLLDPMSDSIYRDTIFICLAVVHEVSLFLVLPILYRDSIIATLRAVCAYRGAVLAARKSGKIKAIFQAAMILVLVILRIVALYVPTVDENLFLIGNILMALVCAITLYSGYEYLRAMSSELRSVTKPTN